MNDTKPIDEVADGDCLAAPVLDANGNVLLPEGKVLNAALIDKLKSLSITELAIVTPHDEEDLDRLRDEITASVEEIFSKTELDALMLELKNRVLAAKLRDLKSRD